MDADVPLPIASEGAIPAGDLRVEYVDFENVAEHREFRFRAYGRAGSTERRVRIANVAFTGGQIRLQDGPDVCYQKLLRAIGAGETATAAVITIDDVELASYREARKPVEKHRARAPVPPPPTPVFAPGPVPRMSRPPLPAAPLPVSDAARGLQPGQRISHPLFGVGVTTSSSDEHTVVCFDQVGPKRFVTSMLEVEVLSAPRTWETGPRGNNRPVKPPRGSMPPS